MRSTPFMYATLESLHILGIAVLVGPAFAFDLRLLGVGRRLIPVTRAARYLFPYPASVSRSWLPQVSHC